MPSNRLKVWAYFITHSKTGKQDIYTTIPSISKACGIKNKDHCRAIIKELQRAGYHIGKRQIVCTPNGVHFTSDARIIERSVNNLRSRIAGMYADIKYIRRTRQRCMGQRKVRI